jgi:hypothetical protein
MLFRTDSPFFKIRREFVAPDGSRQAIEILGKGQQVIVDGLHSDIRKPYCWVGGYGPTTIPRHDLPEINESEAAELVTYIADMLVEKFDFKPVSQSSGAAATDKSGNGYDHAAEAGGGRVDAHAMLAAMGPTGADVNDVQPRVILSLLQQAIHPDDVVTQVVDATMAMAERHRLDWSRDQEIKFVTRRCFSGLRKLVGEYDAATGVIPSWLAGEFHERWIEVLRSGRQPDFGLNRAFYVRGRQEDAAESNTANAGAAEPPTTNHVAKNKEKPKTKPEQGKIRAIPFELFDEAKLKPRAYLYAKHYQRGQCTATIGCGGAGKSTVGIAEATVLTTGCNLLGEQPEQRYRVWLHNADDDTEEMNRRIAAFCRLHKIAMTELVGWLFITGKDKFKVTIASSNGNFSVDHHSVGAIIDTIIENEIDVVIFDPLVALHGVPENDNIRMSEVIHIFGSIAGQCDCSIDICHHTRKPSAGVDEKEFNSDDSRGAGAIREAARSSRVFNRMSKAEAAKAGISEEDRAW